jgi:hypothetical protein
MRERAVSACKSDCRDTQRRLFDSRFELANDRVLNATVLPADERVTVGELPCDSRIDHSISVTGFAAERTKCRSICLCIEFFFRRLEFEQKIWRNDRKPMPWRFSPESSLAFAAFGETRARSPPGGVACTMRLNDIIFIMWNLVTHLTRWYFGISLYRTERLWLLMTRLYQWSVVIGRKYRCVNQHRNLDGLIDRFFVICRASRFKQPAGGLLDDYDVWRKVTGILFIW